MESVENGISPTMSSDYVFNLINRWVSSIGYKLVPSDVLLLNKKFVGLTILNPNFWETTAIQNPVAKPWFMLKSETEAVRRIFFVHVAKYSNALSFTYNRSWYTPLMNPKTIQREMTKFFEAEAISKFRYQKSISKSTAIPLDGIH